MRNDKGKVSYLNAKIMAAMVHGDNGRKRIGGPRHYRHQGLGYYSLNLRLIRRF